MTPQHAESLPYELLLRKAGSACGSASPADTASTAEPVSSAASVLSGPVAAPGKKDVTLLRNVVVHGPNSDERLSALLREVRVLSEKAFHEDCLTEITKKAGWKLSLLVSSDLSVLCGFIVAKVTKGTLSIAKLAVCEDFRKHGFGRFIMDEMAKAAKKQGDVFEVCLSSLPEAVAFYQRLGYKAFRDLKLRSEEDLVEGQVYMEKRLRQRPRK
mmetsp:Transcript_102227/g.289150  ORF Transcript_102227/g.289150 Transcript_102227/m.289150 type:complete len:214 (+) Transcript_102227:75-716(+)